MENEVMEAPTTEQAEQMDLEALEKMVPEEGAAPEREVEAPATAEEKAPEQKSEIQLLREELSKRFEGLEREQGRYRSLQSNFDKLPSMIEQAIANRQQQAALANLSDEEKALYQQQIQSEKDLESKLDRFLAAKYGKEVAFIQQFQNEQMEAQKDQQFMADVASTAGEDFGNLKPVMDEIWNEVAKEIESPDEATREKALARFDALSGSPAAIVLEASRRHAKATATQAQTFANERKGAAKAASQSVASSATNINAGKKPISEMSQKELDALSTDELEKRLAAEGA